MHLNSFIHSAKQQHAHTDTMSSSSQQFRSVYVTANTDPDDSAYIASRPDILLLSNAKLCAAVPRKMGTRKVSNVLAETTIQQSLSNNPSAVPSTTTRKVAALFESQMLEVVYAVRVQESKYQQPPASTSATGDELVDHGGATVSSTPSNANGPRLWCNAVFRCTDEHTRASMGLLDNEIAKIFPPVFLAGFRSGINSVESMLTADKDDPQQIPCLVRMDVPFDDITRTLTVFAVDENNIPIEEPLSTIPSGTRCKAIFAAEMIYSEKPVKRVHIRLTLQQIALLDAINSTPTMAGSLFRMVGEPTTTTTITTTATSEPQNGLGASTDSQIPDRSKDAFLVNDTDSSSKSSEVELPKTKKLKQ